MKLAVITPLHKGKKDNKENDIPGSILPTLSNILEQVLLEQMSVYFDTFLLDQKCGFRKGYST